MNQQFTNPQLAEALKHFGNALISLGGAMSEMPKVTTQDTATSAAATTSKAKASADKKAKETVEEKPDDEKAKAPAAKKAAAKKSDAPDFETLDREAKIDHLREKMVEVSVKVGGDRDKVYSFLTKYKAQKVNELSDENLDALKEDVEVFLAGPAALDI